MYKIKRILHIHMILIYFTYLYSQSCSSSCKQANASEDTTTDSDEMTKEQRELVLRQYAALAQERLFKVKGKPTTNQVNSNTKLYVPRAMLKKYIDYREAVRKFVPDDREFYGKINIADLDTPHEDMWNALSNNGQTDIQIDMGPPEDSLDERKFNVDGKASHIGYLTLDGDPEVVPPKIEHLLPPHSRSVLTKRRFVSVHMKFNLSQEIYLGPTAAEDLKGAELRLTRESIHDCEIYDCPKKPVPFFSHRQDNASSSSSTSSNQDDKDAKIDQRLTRTNLVPKYQKVYILQVNGYDHYNEPQATISSSRRIDTSQTSPIIFNIKPIVKTWLLDPKKNYGIIVRVTNDDKDYDLAIKTQANLNHSGKRETNSTDDSELEFIGRMDVLDHVRLKRSSRSASDSQDAWKDKQPSLLLYSDPKDPEERFHVKRHHDESEMQADEPDSATQRSQQASTASGVDEVQQRHSINGSGQVAAGKLSTTAASPTIKPIGGNGRRSAQAGRASSSGGRASSQQQSSASRSRGKAKPSVRQSDKCSKRQLNINFDEVGWSSWIIAPHSYYANYCAGDCNWPLTDAQNSTNHAIIQAIYRSVGRLVPKSSCAPIQYGRMAILYQLDGIVQMRQYDDMIVEACGCL